VLRVNILSIDGLEIKYSALSVEQVEAYLAPIPEGSPIEAYVTRQRELICQSLNNLNPPDSTPQSVWTPERVKKEMDLLLIVKLHNTIVTFSGLKLAPVSSDSGEPQAVAPPA
jgi:hypothetical protein